MVNRGRMHCKNKLHEIGKSSSSFEMLVGTALATTKTCLNASGVSTPLAIAS